MVSLSKRQVVILLGVILLVVCGWLLWQHYNHPQPVTGEYSNRQKRRLG
ncbi:hypothetical protein [Sporomusa acidovorans]|nr:hypothetical protein [Sporomusa acidovorans]